VSDVKEEAKRRLDRMILMQRLKYVAIGGAVLLALGAFAVFEAWEADRHVDKVTGMIEVHGTVGSSQRAFNRNGGFTMHVQLDDGSWVNASSMLGNIPYDGEKLTLKEYTHASGRKDYVAERFEE
jgi:hypothetical protein